MTNPGRNNGDNNHDDQDTNEFHPVAPEPDFGVRDAYDESQDFAEVEDINLETLAWENLNNETKSGDWVSRDQYESTLRILEGESERAAILTREYDKAYSQNESLRNALESSTRDGSSTQRELMGKQTRLDAELRELEEDQEQFEKDKERNKWLVIGSYSLGAIGVVLAIIFGIMWMTASSEAESQGATSESQNEQVRELNDSLNRERGERREAESSLAEVTQERDEANSSLDTVRSERDGLSQRVSEQDEVIEGLNTQIDELTNRPAETVTEQAPPEIRTETRTQTATTTVTQNNNSDRTVTVTTTVNGE